MARKYIYSLLVLAMTACCHLHAQTRFFARNMYIYTSYGDNTGYMTLLGKNKYGQQLWHFKSNSSSYTNICINLDNPDDFGKYALHFSKQQHLMPGFSYTNENHPESISGTADYFFLTIGETHAYYAVYQNNDWICKYSAEGDYSITAHPSITATTPTFDANSGAYVQNISWDAEGITNDALSNVVIMVSFDGGQKWSNLSEESSVTGNFAVAIPWNVEKVRYRILVYPKDDFKMIVSDDTPWISDDTSDYTLSPIHITGTLRVDNVRDNFADATDVYARTYTPTLAWSIPTAFTNAVDKVSVQYCTKDMGSDWEELFCTTNISGRQTITLPVGIDSLLFRMVITPKDGLAQFEGNSTSDTLTAAIKYEPAFSKIAVDGTVGANYDATANTYTPALTYTMNDDLWQTRLGKAFVYYSIDEGATWTLAKAVDTPAQSGEVQVTLPADAKRYQFRIGIASAVNNAINCGIEESSNVYAYTRTYVLDDKIAY